MTLGSSGKYNPRIVKFSNVSAQGLPGFNQW